MVRIMEDLKNLSIVAERELARTFMGRIEWEMIAIGLTQFVAWIVCWILVINGTFFSYFQQYLLLNIFFSHNVGKDFVIFLFHFYLHFY